MASRWKGVGFFRARVVPANPNSAGVYGQAEHRSLFRTVVSWWHDLEAQVQEECDRLCFGMALSGFNAFVKRNLWDMGLGTAESRKEFAWGRIMPLTFRTASPRVDYRHFAGFGRPAILVACLAGPSGKRRNR